MGPRKTLLKAGLIFLAAGAAAEPVFRNVFHQDAEYALDRLMGEPAWDWRDGRLTHRWTFDSDDGTPGHRAYRGQGNHNLTVADVDGDGKDEIVYGACVIDDNGRGLYSTGLGHGDALHVSDLDPARIDEVVFGHCAMPSEAANSSRIVALRAGVPERVPAVTVHRNCASGMEAVANACHRIGAGDARFADRSCKVTQPLTFDRSGE